MTNLGKQEYHCNIHTKDLLLDVQEASGKAYCNEELLAAFNMEPYRALFYFGFADGHPDMSASFAFLHGFCRAFIAAVSRNPDIEITKTAGTPETAVFLETLRGARGIHKRGLARGAAGELPIEAASSPNRLRAANCFPRCNLMRTRCVRS